MKLANIVGKRSIKDESAVSSAYLRPEQKTINPILQSLLHKQKRSRKHEMTDQ